MAAAKDAETSAKINFEITQSSSSFHRDKSGQSKNTRRSQRLSRHSSNLVDEAIKNCIASCSCTIHQPITVPVDLKWENSKERQDPDARPMVSSKNHVVYLSFSRLDDSYHLTVIKHEENKENKIFLTVPLQDLASGDLKYKIKRPSWHQVTILENSRQQDFIIDLGCDPQGDYFTQKVKDAFENLEHGGAVNGHRDEPPAVRTTPTNDNMDESMMLSGMSRPMSVRPTPFDQLEQIGALLQVAISTGDAHRAKELAGRLAAERICLLIQLNKEENERRLAENSISVKVHVEDRETSGCIINLKVKPSDTIGYLKQRMLLQYEFPVEVQRWIIGKKIPKDNESLHRCGVKGSGHTLYLYLTTARSVGLDEHQLDPTNRGAVGGEASGDYMTMRTMKESMRRGGESLNRQPSRQMSTLSSSSGTLPAVSENDQTSVQPPSPLRTSESAPGIFQGRGRGQGRGLSHNTSDFQGVQDDTVFVTGPPVSISGLQGAAAATTQPVSETTNVGWECPRCTFLNKPTRPGCEVCGGDKPEGYQPPIGYIMTKEELCWLAEKEEQERMLQEAERQQEQQLVERSRKNYSELLTLDNRDLVPNTTAFDCPICFDTIPPREGVVLRDCLHMFCQDCLMNAVRTTEEASLKCPFQDDEYACTAMLQDREIRALVSEEIYNRYLQRSLDTAESQASNSYHCKTADCHGWCIYEDLVNFFQCPVCKKENCLTCKAIHENMNCQQYQDDLRIRSANDQAAQQTQRMLSRLVSEGEAMPCPQCQVIVQKKDGCDWIKCSICKTEICWVTKGPRWGPKGEGDTSGGCGCRVGGKKCDPRCNNCH